MITEYFKILSMLFGGFCALAGIMCVLFGPIFIGERVARYYYVNTDLSREESNARGIIACSIGYLIIILLIPIGVIISK